MLSRNISLAVFLGLALVLLSVANASAQQRKDAPVVVIEEQVPEELSADSQKPAIRAKRQYGYGGYPYGGYGGYGYGGYGGGYGGYGGGRRVVIIKKIITNGGGYGGYPYYG